MPFNQIYSTLWTGELYFVFLGIFFYFFYDGTLKEFFKSLKTINGFKQGHHWFFTWSKKRNAAAAAAKSLQSCPTLSDPIDGSPPGSPIPGILQARTLEWVAISFSNAWKWKVKVKSFSRVQFLVTPLTAAHQAPSSMGFSRQEYWSGVPSPEKRNRLVLYKLTFLFFSPMD